MSDKDEGGRAFLVVDGKVCEAKPVTGRGPCGGCDHNPANLCNRAGWACVTDKRLAKKVWKHKEDGKVT